MLLLRRALRWVSIKLTEAVSLPWRVISNEIASDMFVNHFPACAVEDRLMLLWRDINSDHVVHATLGDAFGSKGGCRQLASRVFEPKWRGLHI